jgi:hypothetical protein
MTTTSNSGRPASGTEDDPEELAQQVGNALVDLVGETGWQRIDLISRMTVPVQDLSLTVLANDGSTTEAAPPVELNVLLAKLRVALYQRDPERGAWFSARFVIDAPGTFYRTYNRDYEPDWKPAIEDSSYVEDLRMFPRALEYTPEWLLDKLPEWKDRPAPPAKDITQLMPLNMVMVGELLDGFRDHLLHRAPAEWQQLFIDFRSVGSYVETRAQVITVLGQAFAWEPPQADGFFAGLRRGMYKAGEGTWTSVKFHLVVSGKYHAEYEWYREPDWDHVPDQRFFREELELYPRDEATVPDWLRTRANLRR